MDQVVIEARPRNEIGSRAAMQYRTKNDIPANLYGGDKPNVLLLLKESDIDRTISKGTKMIELNLQGQRETALVKEIQHDALGDRVIHVDFARVAMDEEVEIEVEVKIKGEAKGAKEGGNLQVFTHELSVQCLPRDIPEHIIIDVSGLEIGQAIHAGEIKPPSGVVVTTNPEVIVVMVSKPVEEKEAEAEDAEGGAKEPEVIGKKEEESEESSE